MKGFDPKWKDFPDYILGITAEIWEGRGIATLHKNYAPDIHVRSPGSMENGNQGVIAATMATLAEFPDRRLLGEDVIWSGSPEEGMLSSHRILSTATHAGDGVSGNATGQTLRARIIADCHASNHQIKAEWLIRDQGAIVRQLGWDPRAYAADLVEREGGAENCVRPFTPAIDVAGPYRGRGNDNEWGARYADILNRIMGADMAAIPASYDAACQLELPGGLTEHGHDAADRFWMGLRASFPTRPSASNTRSGARMPANRRGPRSAGVFTAEHEGWGSFGEPSGAEVYVMGIGHAEFEPRGLRREFVLFDETAIWKQIVMQTG